MRRGEVRRALRHKVRSYADVNYELGQKVFYKKVGFKSWKGPANVIGIDHKNVIVRQGSSIYRCHPCNLMKVDLGMTKQPVRNEGNEVSAENNQSTVEPVEKRRNRKEMEYEDDSESDEEFESNENTIGSDQITEDDAENAAESNQRVEVEIESDQEYTENAVGDQRIEGEADSDHSEK